MTHSVSRVCVIGLGYIGLPTAAVIAGRGIDVLGVDVQMSVVNTINRGEIHIVEPELDIVVRAAVTSGKLSAALAPAPAYIFIVAVPTPFKGDHEPDMSYVKSATMSIAPVLKAGDLVILESTSPVGSTDLMCRWLAEARPDLRMPDVHGEHAEIFVAHCPERVLPGRVLHELTNNDRIIGGISARCSAKAKEFYEIFVSGQCLVTDAKTAEMAKLTENTFRDVNIAFANELSLICEEIGVDVWELISLANRHPRVNILQPGCGVGGHCIAVDPWFIVSRSPETARLTRTAREVNNHKPHYVVEKVLSAATNSGGAIACLGLAFKPDIDDLRESPAMEIVLELASRSGRRVLVVEPNIDSLPAILADKCDLVSLDVACQQADVIAVLVKHKPFERLSLKVENGKQILDFVNAG